VSGLRGARTGGRPPGGGAGVPVAGGRPLPPNDDAAEQGAANENENGWRIRDYTKVVVNGDK